MDERIGLVGYGAMGSAFCERLQANGVAPVVYDVALAALEAAASVGLPIASSAAQLAVQSDLISVIVATDEQVLAVTLGEGGVLAGARPGSVVVLHSTILPETTFEIARQASGRGVHVVDACACAIPAAVRAGRLHFLVGGDDNVVARVRPYLLLMAKDMYVIGGLGAGNVAKLIKQTVTAAETLVLWEMTQISETFGISYTAVLDMLRDTRVDHPSPIDRWERLFDASGASPLPWSGWHVDKDVSLTAALGQGEGLKLPLLTELRERAHALKQCNEGRQWPPPTK